MAFDQTTRNRLARFVSDARTLIAGEFTDKFQSLYGISEKGALTPLEKLTHLDQTQLATAALLRERIDYLVRSYPEEKGGVDAAVERLAREQAFTFVNRLAAIRMAEKRGLIVESVGRGYESKGFKVFSTVAGAGLGEMHHRYRRYLYCLFDELSVDLGVLFDRQSPHGLLFPRENALLEFFDLINAPDLEALWSEDETIGWIYQYYNDPAERKKMRDQSAAPRSSRELAVRNQFFTPRYVVEFLTDNTLGRLWYEMTKARTQLRDQCRYLVRRPTEIFLKPGESTSENPAGSEAKARENLSREDLLQQPVHIPHRPLKDPREIRLLDPACGSMHFGLYAFDLFTVIYDEAWEIAHGPDAAAKSVETFAAFVTFAASFADKAAFLREVPRLILERNLHGIDIDPRAAQIAGLSLWLRAHRAWQRAGVKPGDRPRITRSNLVCAEPMPGEKELLREFVERAFPAGERPAFAFLLEKIFDCMSLAGEAGSLLRVEVEIRTAIAEARALAQLQSAPRQAALFAGTERSEHEEFNLRGLTDEQFWEKAEERIYDALETYAEQAENGGGFQRRLFANDAAQGFALIDLCRKRYDVVVMNPPFGAFVSSTKDYAATRYPKSWRDMFSSFIERGIQVLVPRGFCGAITSSTYLNLSTLEEFRDFLLSDVSPQVIVNLGPGVMDDAAVSAACSVVYNQPPSDSEAIWFIEARDAEDRSVAISSVQCGDYSRLYCVTAAILRAFPQSIFVYWLSESLRNVFANLQRLEHAAHCQFGLHCRGNDDQLFRAWWEVAPRSDFNTNWPVVKLGGDPEHFYRDSHYVLDWRGNGAALTEIAQNAPGGTLNGAEYYFQPGLTYIYTAQTTFSVQPLESRSVFTAAAHGCLPKEQRDYLPYLALLNTEPVRLFLKVINPNRFFQSNYVRLLPIPPLSEHRAILETSAKSALRICRRHAQGDECSRLFVTEWTCRGGRDGGRGFDGAVNDANETARALAETKAQADHAAIAAYQLQPRDLALLQSHIGASTARILPGDQPLLQQPPRILAESLLHYLVGCLFGRWDIRYATGERPAPELPDPFAPLPVCPPGMLQGDEGLPLSPEAGRRLRAEGCYPLDVAWDGILVDDPEHPLDFERRVHATLAVLWGNRADELEHEACALLGVPTLREWFRRPAGFFADHLKRYSKSRRQAPIYWPLSTASGRYTLWFYYHRLDDQILHKAIADFAEPKLKSVRAELSALRESGKHGNRLEDLLDFETELVEFRAELERIIKLPWKPNLNDGVLITASPLWKLFGLRKWRDDLWACWEQLSNGDYAWAHLAHSIWPSRVEEKCKTDRSIAIAHGLEHLCKVEPPKPKRPKATRKKANAFEAEGRAPVLQSAPSKVYVRADKPLH